MQLWWRLHAILSCVQGIGEWLLSNPQPSWICVEGLNPRPTVHHWGQLDRSIVLVLLQCFIERVVSIFDNFCNLGFSTLQDDDYYCPNCTFKQHQCFACNKLGRSCKTATAPQEVSTTFFTPIIVCKILKVLIYLNLSVEFFTLGQSWCFVYVCFTEILRNTTPWVFYCITGLLL